MQEHLNRCTYDYENAKTSDRAHTSSPISSGPAAEEGHNPARSPPKAPHSFMNSTQFCCKLAKPLQQMHECMYSLVLTCTRTLLKPVNVFGVRTKYMYSTFQIRWDSEALVHSSCRQTSGNSVSETMHISVQFIPRSQDVYRQLLCLLKKNKLYFSVLTERSGSPSNGYPAVAYSIHSQTSLVSLVSHSPL